MPLSWRDYLMMHWPILALGAISTVTMVYTFGFESGKRSMLFAAERASVEARGEWSIV